jgi:hypothetical protein
MIISLETRSDRSEMRNLPAENRMDTNLSPPVRTFIPAALILMILGWGGLFAIVAYTTPTGGSRWAFFFSAVLALSGTALPAVAYLNRRFPSTPPSTPAVILRQAIWIGIYLPTLAWLQIGRVLTPALALLLAIGLMLIEWLLRLRERSQWNPEQDTQYTTPKKRAQ